MTDSGSATTPTPSNEAPSKLVVGSVGIGNFKSIDRLELELGRVNVLIGENGCGKTNLLEAIGFGAAAAAGKLDREFLITRGIRVARPELMRSGFEASTITGPVTMHFTGGSTVGFVAGLSNTNEPYARWENFDDRLMPIVRFLKETEAETTASEQDAELSTTLDDMMTQLIEITKTIANVGPIGPEPVEEEEPSLADKPGRRAERLEKRLEVYKKRVHERTRALANFLIFSPLVTTLRTLSVESQIEPLGIHGEGLFRLLKSLEEEGRLAEVNHNLRMIEWLDALEVSASAAPADRSIRLHDHYMAPDVPLLDEQSSNDGVLFLLFYVCLFMSRHTPSFFAIDNIDNALNPKLASHLMSTIVQLAAKHGKQAILSTHNPAVLDGLDLADDSQRLLVVYRNLEGRTRVRRIMPNELGPDAKSIRLSEAFIRGYLGGLPSNF